MMTDEQKIKAWNLVDALRAPEGDSVTLLCDNPEGPPNAAVECCGDWTGYNTERFDGEDIMSALDAAHSMKLSREEKRLYANELT